MEYLYLPQSGDREIISDEILKYERFSFDNSKLVKNTLDINQSKPRILTYDVRDMAIVIL